MADSAGDAVALRLGRDDVADREGEAAEKAEAEPDQRPAAEAAAPSSCQNMSAMPASPSERAERDARPQRLAEKERRERDIGERGEREDHRQQPGNDVVAGIVEEDEVGRVEEEAERREALRCVRSGKRKRARRRARQTRNISGAASRKRQTSDTCGSTTPSWNLSASQVVPQTSTVPAKRPKSHGRKRRARRRRGRTLVMCRPCGCVGMDDGFMRGVRARLPVNPSDRLAISGADRSLQ